MLGRLMTPQPMHKPTRITGLKPQQTVMMLVRVGPYGTLLAMNRMIGQGQMNLVLLLQMHFPSQDLMRINMHLMEKVVVVDFIGIALRQQVAITDGFM